MSWRTYPSTFYWTFSHSNLKMVLKNRGQKNNSETRRDLPALVRKATAQAHRKHHESI